MESETMDAIRHLVEFAQDYSGQIFKLDGGSDSQRFADMGEAIKIALDYLDDPEELIIQGE